MIYAIYIYINTEIMYIYNIYMGHSMVNVHFFYLTPSEFLQTCWKPSLGRNIGENQCFRFLAHFKGSFWPLNERPLKRL